MFQLGCFQSTSTLNGVTVPANLIVDRLERSGPSQGYAHDVLEEVHNELKSQIKAELEYAHGKARLLGITAAHLSSLQFIPQ